MTSIPTDGPASPRSARTPACRVHTRVNACDSVAIGPRLQRKWVSGIATEPRP
jgi:hypothetical protein